MSYFCYRHIRPDKEEIFYIGVGKSQPYNTDESKFGRAYSKYHRNKYWRNIVINNPDYIIEVLYESEDYEFILEKEKEFIKLYGRKDLGLGTLVNMTDGGEGSLNMSQEHRDRIKKSLTGRKLSPEQMELIRIRSTGKVWSEESKDKFRAFRKGKVHSKETKVKIAKSHSKECYQFSVDGILIKRWDSRLQASKSLNIDNSDIGKSIKHKRKKAGGFIWKSRLD